MDDTSNAADKRVSLIEENSDEIMEINIDDEEIKQNVYSENDGWFSNMCYVIQS